MDCTTYDPYVLPTIEFVGGETQKLRFRVFFKNTGTPFNLGTGQEQYTAQFAVVSFVNKRSDPVIVKSMTVAPDTTNVLCVTLTPSDTIELAGKYVYQITIKDPFDGEVEIPKQGILVIINNINKQFR